MASLVASNAMHPSVSAAGKAQETIPSTSSKFVMRFVKTWDLVLPRSFSEANRPSVLSNNSQRQEKSGLVVQLPLTPKGTNLHVCKCSACLKQRGLVVVWSGRERGKEGRRRRGGRDEGEQGGEGGEEGRGERTVSVGDEGGGGGRGTNDSRHGESVLARAYYAPNWVAEEHLGASSRRPRHPFPALMAGATPGRVPVYTAQKNSFRHAMNSTCGAAQQGHRPPQQCTVTDLHLCSSTACTATLAIQLELEVVVVVGAKIVNAAIQSLSMQTHPTSTRVLDVIDGVLPFIGFTLSQAKS